MSIKIAAIFDMDGVICHTNPYHSEAFRIFFSRRGFIPTDAEFAEHMFGKSNSYILSHFLKRTIKGDELKALEEEKEGLFREIYRDKVTPLPGLIDFFYDLKACGFKLGVATSAPFANLDMILKALGITGLFESMLASEDVIYHKPDPEVYLKSASNLGVSPDCCVVFEDSFSGITAATGTGAKVVGILTSHQPAELPPCQLYVPDYTTLNGEKILDLLS
ncbi:HAD family hydrolase [Ravibacter arvi]|uniref:HAD family hydrolase n=1 Tax=Ravibacter arvi TaxID=2051041 RepID=A0ABP8LT06_9BACT